MTIADNLEFKQNPNKHRWTRLFKARYKHLTENEMKCQDKEVNNKKE